MDDSRNAAVQSLCRAWKDCELLPHEERAWPARALELCRAHGYFGWFAAEAWQGQAWSVCDLLETYVQLARVNLTPAFILTQRAAAVDRLEQFATEQLQARIMPELVHGGLWATVAISHLTTSRQHLGQPPVLAEPTEGGWLLSGETPWVTGAMHSDWLVVGASTASREQLLVAIETAQRGVEVQPPQDLLALAGSLTGAVRFRDAWLPAEQVLRGPNQDVMASGTGGRTGGLPTSALALGHARRCIDYLKEEGLNRPDLLGIAESLEREWDDRYQRLLEMARRAAGGDAEHIRQQANDLVVRAAQSALVAAKGAGFVAGHPAGRWCREALFFLVWSCPQRVLLRNLKEWAGIEHEGFC